MNCVVNEFCAIEKRFFQVVPEIVDKGGVWSWGRLFSVVAVEFCNFLVLFNVTSS